MASRQLLNFFGGLPFGKLTLPWKIPIFPGTYHQNGRLFMAMLVYRSVIRFTNQNSGQIILSFLTRNDQVNFGKKLPTLAEKTPCNWQFVSMKFADHV